MLPVVARKKIQMLVMLFAVTLTSNHLWAVHYSRQTYEEAKQILEAQKDEQTKTQENTEYQKAKELYSVPCQNGDVQACKKLARVESRMLNKDESIRLYTIACNKGDMESCGEAGAQLSMIGNNEEARRLLTLACKKGKGPYKNSTCRILRGL